MRLFLNHGADVNGFPAQRNNATVLQIAALKGYISIAYLLLEYGAEVDAPASKVDGVTSLEGAVWQGRLDMVVILLRAGAGRKSKDKKQFAYAAGRARENCYDHIARLIEKYALTGKIRNGDFPGDYPGEKLFDFDRYDKEQGDMMLQ